MDDIMVDVLAVARMANDVGGSAGVINADDLGSCADGGSQAVATALELFSTDYVSEMKNLRVKISDIATDALASANDYSAIDQTYFATFHSFAEDVG